MKKIQVGTSKIYIPNIINGLTTESSKVKKAYNNIKPDLVTIQTSEEELSGLKQVVEGVEHEHFLSNYEEIYARKLASFGEVKVPPPCYETALKLCQENDVPIAAIDMDDMLFADVFCESVSGWDLFRHSLRVGRLKRKRFRAKTPEEFVIKWDREISKLKGFRNLEKKREEHMARELVRLAKDHRRILCIIEMQRAEGVSQKILEGSK
ncbi:MAG: hypothetical protein JSV56_06510 [Methanomassiliicoccales archaeon]|nr:MAG: hypothetical protein JSV56_06510 [Methanomassiliicoccales archaeon]